MCSSDSPASLFAVVSCVNCPSSSPEPERQARYLWSFTGTGQLQDSLRQRNWRCKRAAREHQTSQCLLLFAALLAIYVSTRVQASYGVPSLMYAPANFRVLNEKDGRDCCHTCLIRSGQYGNSTNNAIAHLASLTQRRILLPRPPAIVSLGAPSATSLRPQVLLLTKDGRKQSLVMQGMYLPKRLEGSDSLESYHATAQCESPYHVTQA